MMKATLKLILMACCLSAHAPAARAACSCEQLTVSKAKALAEVVFAGAVVAVHRERTVDGFEWRVRLSVEQEWKGEGTGELVVYTSGECATQFEAAKRYLVFARRQEGRGRLTTDSCMRTAPLEAATEEDLRRLGKAKARAAVNNRKATE